MDRLSHLMLSTCSLCSVVDFLWLGWGRATGGEGVEVVVKDNVPE